MQAARQLSKFCTSLCLCRVRNSALGGNPGDVAAPVVPPVPAAAVVADEGAKLLIAVYISRGEWLKIPGDEKEAPPWQFPESPILLK